MHILQWGEEDLQNEAKIKSNENATYNQQSKIITNKLERNQNISTWNQRNLKRNESTTEKLDSTAPSGRTPAKNHGQKNTYIKKTVVPENKTISSKISIK